MKKSATQLGKPYNLTGEEMNYILKEQGFQDGDPRDYTPTEKGRAYVERKEHHRGTGGYAHYNRSWLTTKWDESISDELDMSEEKIKEARAAVAERRRLARQKTQDDVTVLMEDENESSDDSENDDQVRMSSADSKTTLIGIIIGACAILGVIIFPHIKKWWKNKVSPKVRRSKGSTACPKCGARMVLAKKSETWICCSCELKVSDKELAKMME